MTPAAPTGFRPALMRVLRGDEREEDACRRLGVDQDRFRAWTTAHLESKHYAHRLRLQARGLTGRARIVRDRWGVAHCFGTALDDVYFAVGVAQAQDRLWQLDYRRRFASGCLAAVLGESALERDRQHRTLGFRRVAEEVELPALDPEARRVLHAYAAGVNAWIEQLGPYLPVEFEILEYEPEPWSPIDSLTVLRHFWWTLSGRLSQLVAAERLLRSVSPEVAAWFLTPETVAYIAPEAGDARAAKADDTGPGFGGIWGSSSHRSVDHRDRASGRAPEPGSTAAEHSAYDDRDGDDVPGSNNWVVGPLRTTTGAPVLAADPHWPFSFPDMWYEHHVCGGDTDCVGAAYPGVPPIIFGRNRNVSWGRTNNVSSTRDLYHECLCPEDPSRYWNGSAWERFHVVEERLQVRGADAVAHAVRFTRHGPLVDEWIPAVESGDDGPMSLRWVGHERLGDVQALLDLSRARDADDLLEIFAGWRLSVWNVVYADRQGHFGYQMAGSVPCRGVLTRGTRPAFEAGHEWEDYVSTPELPGVRDPRRGWVASANNVPAPPGYPQPLYGHYADGYRHDRIGQLLSAGDALTPDQVAAVQSDTLDARAAQLKGEVARLLEGGDTELSAAAAQLRAWCGRYDPDQTGAAFWAALWPRLVRRVGRTVLEPHAAELNASHAGRLVRHLLRGGSAKCYHGDLEAEVRAAAREALEYLRRALGPAPHDWAWERAHVVRLRHPLATNPAAAKVLNPPPFSCPGGSAINNRWSRAGDDGFTVTGGSSYRFVADLSRPDAAQGCLVAGQSGLPCHRHYADQAGLWPRGEYYPLLMDEGAVEAHAESVTTLDPGG